LTNRNHVDQPSSSLNQSTNISPWTTLLTNQVRPGDVIRFGDSQRMYLVHGPEFLRPPELESETLAKVVGSELELELELIQTRVIQKPLLWVEVGKSAWQWL
jgi:hypothetical protein